MNVRTMIGAWLGVAALAMAAGCNERRPDTQITADVRKELAEEEVPGTIDVSTANAVVTLSGTVPNQEAKDEAEDAAEDVAGVDRVVNNLTTAPAAAPQAMAPRASTAP
ncbi:MAG: BON domain-containing protein [Candidatus Binatia bacterium]